MALKDEQRELEGILRGWFGDAMMNSLPVDEIPAWFAASSFPGWGYAEAVVDSGEFTAPTGNFDSGVRPVDLGIFSLEDRDHRAALAWIAGLFEEMAHETPGVGVPSGAGVVHSSGDHLREPERFFCESDCDGARTVPEPDEGARDFHLSAYAEWSALFAACGPGEGRHDGDWESIGSLRGKLRSPWSRKAGEECARVFGRYTAAFRRAAANTSAPFADRVHLILTWTGIVMSYRVTLAELGRRERVAAQQGYPDGVEGSPSRAARAAEGDLPTLPPTPKVDPRTTHGDLRAIGADSYRSIPGLLLGWWNVVGRDGMPEAEQRARFYLCLTSMADYGDSYGRLGLGGSLDIPENLRFPTVGHAAWRHSVANHGIRFQRDMDAIAGQAPYRIADTPFTGWLSGYPPGLRVAAMVAMGYSNYGVWAFPAPRSLPEMLYGAWNMMLAVLVPSFTDIDAEAAAYETGTLCRALTASATGRLVGRMHEFLPLRPENDDIADRMLLSGMAYCWWGERGNVYARVMRFGARLRGEPVPDEPAPGDWDRVQSAAARGARAARGVGEGRGVREDLGVRVLGVRRGLGADRVCGCAERLEGELAHVLHGLDRDSVGAGTLAEALEKEVSLWHRVPELHRAMTSNSPNTRVAIRRLMRAVMAPGAAHDVMLEAFRVGWVMCGAGSAQRTGDQV
ncbi:hypothetical protein AB0O01_13570 [Streptomyces sp. NPDC093252]|uniref:hypothetical protein n=1 Tax=Streptomyces sp. NPDC093252 TaxID=3154980 RepID=UPI003427E83C